MDIDSTHSDKRTEGGKDDFVRDTNIHTGNFAYKCRDNGAEYETVLVGEIMPRPCGTKLNAMGNQEMVQPNVIDDKVRVKAVLALGQPTQSTKMMYITFGNQMATLDDVIQSDIEEQTRAPEYIIVHTEQLYAVRECNE